MRRRALVVLCLAAAGAGPVGCGGDDSSRTTTAADRTNQATTTAPKPTAPRRRLAPDEYKGVYADAKDVCEIATPQKVAKVVGSPTARPRDIARTVAKGYKPSLRKKAYAGCLAGLD